ncbi:MAG: hypothetical protein HUJ88_12880 [Fusobacterium necrophorum]|nr:hypothetical protein [Fusobacterium necrophorum]
MNIPIQEEFLEKEGNLKYKSFAVRDAQIAIEKKRLREEIEEKRKIAIEKIERKIPKKSKEKNDKQRE